ncbi:MAG: OsmC family peroxiredoxin [Flavobacteriaceae bacterium]|nr:OsmC family peroxiredoxin [Flavobacteriaceae bacterium]
MSTGTTKYLGKLRCSNIHTHSGTEILTDAPLDNQGLASAFSPTDLCALSLTTCIITTMAIYARLKEFEIIHIEAETTKHMMLDPRRIGKISAVINITLPANATERMQEGLKRVAHTCPVSKSLHPEIEQDVRINIELAS